MKETNLKKLMSGIFAAAIVMAAGTEASMAQEPASNLDSAKSRTQQLMGDIAPKLAELTDDVLYADIWERPQLSQRDRSLVTVSALIALNRPDQLRSHLVRAKANGLTEEQLVEDHHPYGVLFRLAERRVGSGNRQGSLRRKVDRFRRFP